MVPQLLPPVAATTIGTPTQRAPSDRNPAAAACGVAAVFTFYFVLLALCLPHPRRELKHNTPSTSKMCVTYRTQRMHTMCGCARAGIQQVNRENQMSPPPMELPGGGGRVRSAPSESCKQTMRFSPNTRAGGPRGVAI